MDAHGITSKTLLFLFLIIPFDLSIQLANALAPTLVETICISGTYSPWDDGYTASTSSLLSDLTNHSSNTTFYHSTSGAGDNTTYGLFYCTAGVDPQDCNACIESAVNDTQNHCEYYREAVVFYQECTLRYSDKPVYAIEDESEGAWSYDYSYVSYKQFNKTLYSTLNTVITQAAYGDGSKGFSTVDARLVGAKRERLYVFAQCTPDILGSGCEKCLRAAVERFGDCCGYFGAERSFLMSFYPSCQLRHSVRNSTDDGIIPFSSTSSPSLSSSSSSPSSSSPSSSSDRPGIFMYAKLLALVVAAVSLH